MKTRSTKKPYLIALACLSLSGLVLAVAFIDLVAFGDGSRNLSVEYSSNNTDGEFVKQLRNDTMRDLIDAVDGEYTDATHDQFIERMPAGVFPWTERQLEDINARAKTNPAINKILRPGEGESVLSENVTNIEYLSTLNPDNVAQSLIYIGDYFSERGYEASLVSISIIDGIETRRDQHKLFFFQVDGEETIYVASLKDPEYSWVVGIRDVSDQRYLQLITKEFRELLRRRGFLT